MIDAQPMLQIENLAVAAGGKRLLHAIGFDLAANEFLAVTGPSGVGKSTLLRAIAGLDDPAEGQVLLHGQTPASHGWPAFRRRIVFMHQRPVMLAGSVRENLQHPLRFHSVDRAFDDGEAKRLLGRLGLHTSHLDQEANTLSVGEQQRISLVRALLIGPEVLLLDEPTSALDELSREALERVLHEDLKQRGCAAILVTHDRAQAARLCDREIRLAAHVAADARDGRDEHGT
jgi:putative ABC transport system ATP-binding protein